MCPNPPPDLLAYRRHVGDRVRATRTGQGLTQQALADRAGLDKQAVSMIENAHSSPRLDTLWRLATALGVPVAVLVSEDPE
ncbi:helix-turn-helix domain-containing protein [Streptomyces sp. NPDC017615]|uniref:helix-turn-helix domain-containing protein n=1 Tax=Streptomyces sp. NPDC017615 TaxID=3365003 RepID=UPI0037AFCFEB